jgi:hypothetical protein
MRTQTFSTEATVERDGTVTIRSLPFRPGDRVQVTVIPSAPPEDEVARYPLRGTTYRFDEPFEPVAAADWEADR